MKDSLAALTRDLDAGVDGLRFVGFLDVVSGQRHPAGRWES